MAGDRKQRGEKREKRRGEKRREEVERKSRMSN
jgi:hypothetical protein